MMGIFGSMMREDEGASMVEYALLLCLIVLVVLTGASDLGKSLDRVFDSVREALRGLGY
ncbi:MAG TPA: Flp family type IVb pilin [Candidatus Cybelea sp.]|nr:Flp family type IVb pilin [Candidatus Cybelea sp.]